MSRSVSTSRCPSSRARAAQRQVPAVEGGALSRRCDHGHHRRAPGATTNTEPRRRAPSGRHARSRDLRYLYINPLGAQWLRRTPQEVIGRRMAEIMGEAALAQIRPYIDRVLAGEPVSYEREVEYPAVGRRWASVRFAPVRGWVGRHHHRHPRAQAHGRSFARGRPAQGPVHRHARARAAQSTRADPYSRGDPRARILRAGSRVEPRRHRAAGRPHVAPGGRPARRRARLERKAPSAQGAHHTEAAVAAARDQPAGHRRCWAALHDRVPVQPVVLDADPTRLAQVLSNVLNNAAKYTAPGGSIELSALVEAGVSSSR